MKKRKATMILTAALCLTLAACGQEGSGEVQNTPAATETASAVAEEASPSEEPEEMESEEPSVEELVQEEDEYAAFLNGDAKVKIACEDAYIPNLEENGEYTFAELTETITKNDYGEDLTPDIYRASYECNGKKVLLLMYQGMDIYCDNDDSSSTLVISKEDDGYELGYIGNEWARSSFELNANGFWKSSGSAGAADHYFEEGFLDEHGRCNTIVESEACGLGWIGGQFQYFENGFFSEETIRLANELDAYCTEKDGLFLEVDLFRIDGDLYGEGYFDGYEEDIAELKASAENDGLVWLESEEMNELIDEKIIEAGYEPDDNSEPDWILIN